MNKEKNERYRETDQKIISYVLQEMQTRPVNEITVTDVCKSLHLNRSSFYLHYSDVYAVADAIFSKEMKELGDSFNRVGETGTKFDPMDYLLTMFRLVKEHKVFYRTYLSDSRLGIRSEGTDYLLREIVIPQSAQMGIDEWEAEMRFIFARAGIFSLCRKWVLEDCRQSPEQMVEVVKKCVNMSGYVW